MKPSSLLLFDIDGTLLNAGELSVEAYKKAFFDVLGESYNIRAIECSGRTDPYIVASVLELNKTNKEKDRQIIKAVHDRFVEHIKKLVKNGYRVELLPNVLPVLERLHQQDDIAIGLLTGNLREGAFAKLQAAGIDYFFDFGAFGSDNVDRNKLGDIARKRAQQKFNTLFSQENIWVIGDTVHDITCARSAGFHIAAVASGKTPYSTLAYAEPDLLFEQLSLANLDQITDNRQIGGVCL